MSAGRPGSGELNIATEIITAWLIVVCGWPSARARQAAERFTARMDGQ